MSKHLISSVKNKVRTIKFNQPGKKNAISTDMYRIITNILKEDSEDNDVAATIITGTGDYFSSGNELELPDEGDIKVSLTKRINVFKTFIDTVIDYPKLLIAVVNGPAIGVATTVLGLCDIVYASEKATFYTPFLNLGICPEGCSSYLFPLIMGRSKANEMLYLGHKMTAQEAHQFGLVSKVIPHRQLGSFIKGLHKYGDLSVNSLKKVKKLMNGDLAKTLHARNEEECKLLIELFKSEEALEKMVQFFTRKSKL